MIRHIYAVVHLILMVNLAKTVDLQPPNVWTVGSELQWKSANDDSVLYSVQYKLSSKPTEEWHNMSSYIGTKLKTLNITAEFYGAMFRVCAEKGNLTSEWQNSKPVKCLNIQYCVPLMQLTVKPGMAHLYMEHMDQSLVEEFGNGIAFNISYWKVANGDHSEVQFYITNGNSQLFPNLESGREYCFQVQYLWYNKPYGNTSLQRCAFIPETAEEKKRRGLILSILATVFVSAMCVCCIFAFYKNHKKLKQLFRPPPEIPDHYREFLTGEYFQQLYRSPSSQSLWSCDIITLIENNKIEPNGQEEEQERRS